MARTRIYHRRIELRAEPGIVRGDLADDAHHFRVAIHHAGGRVTAAEGEALRFPWTTCPLSAVNLRALDGMPLSPRATAVGAHANPRSNCTHLFDVAGLAVAHAAAGRVFRRYHCTVADSDDLPGNESATLTRDERPLLAWRIEASTIQAPPPFDGIPLRGDFMAWAERSLGPELAEAAIVLRRACTISPVRHYPLDRFTHAAEAQEPKGQCYTYTRGTVEQALRVLDSKRNYTDCPERLFEAGEPRQ